MQFVTASAIDVEPCAGALGAVVRGVDLGQVTTEAEAEPLRELLVRHQVLFLPDQHLQEEEQLRFARCWGEPEIHPFLTKVPGFPEVVELATDGGRVADVWHTDVTFQAAPPKLSILRAVTTPAVGGDTMWSSQTAAYESLSEPIRVLLRGLSAIHTAEAFGDPEQQAEHPVVRIHAETGQPGLFVNRLFTKRIVQLAPHESSALLSMLWAHSEQPRLTVRLRWAEGTVAIWDNRCTQHFVLDDFTGLRVMRRVTVLGDAPVGPAGPGGAGATAGAGVTGG